MVLTLLCSGCCCWCCCCESNCSLTICSCRIISDKRRSFSIKFSPERAFCKDATGSASLEKEHILLIDLIYIASVNEGSMRKDVWNCCQALNKRLSALCLSATIALIHLCFNQPPYYFSVLQRVVYLRRSHHFSTCCTRCALLKLFVFDSVHCSPVS